MLYHELSFGRGHKQDTREQKKADNGAETDICASEIIVRTAEDRGGSEAYGAVQAVKNIPTFWSGDIAIFLKVILPFWIEILLR